MKLCFVFVTLFLYIQCVLAASNQPYSVSVTDFGAVGDGTTDNTAAFQQALNSAASSHGSIVLVSPGQFLIKGQLQIPEAITLQGTFRGPPRSYDTGSILLTTFGHNDSSAGAFISLTTDSAVVGLIIFYPLQISYPQPVPYGPTIRQTADSPTIKDLLIVNPWWALDLGTVTGGRHVVDGVWAQPLFLGLYIDNCFDVGRVSNVHFWPFWNSSEAFFSTWTAHQATAFKLGRSDWQMIDSTFSFGYSVGFHFFAGDSGVGGNYLITNSGSDEPGTPVLVEVAWPWQGLLFTNCQFMGRSIQITSTNTAPVKFTSCAFVGNPSGGNMGYNGTDNLIVVSGGSLKVSQSEFFMYAQSTAGSAAIVVQNDARAVITSCEFRAMATPKNEAQFYVNSTAIFSHNLCAGACNVQSTGQNQIVSENLAFT